MKKYAIFLLNDKGYYAMSFDKNGKYGSGRGFAPKLFPSKKEAEKEIPGILSKSSWIKRHSIKVLPAVVYYDQN